ncbi:MULTISPECIES: glucose-6-phosphate isomerase [Limibacillus]|jgi:glucose-6-phosphate isomerase|uniref:Glucose-6-phosphate isomerase n=1 Tax=Limibacillus halophilus TaxID=1579333 RepID=A0A839SWF9_9PROT|nr:glucose-6-phosphate isomerase [Limibacillus halophilus]MBB3066030.1 glucose-6-phosphate isomerase [Limibacillus halophilus]
MSYRIDSNGCLASVIGEQGLAEATYRGMLRRAVRACEGLARQRTSGQMALLQVPEWRSDLDEIEALATRFRESFDQIFILGTGGSSLGARTITRLAGFSSKPRLIFLENVDPVSVSDRLADCDPARAGVIVISKSGGTAETLAQAALVLDFFRSALDEAALPAHFLVLTEQRDSALSRLAARFSLPRTDHVTDIGGRFAVLTNVGLLPARLAGLDCAALRAGAAEALNRCLVSGESDENLPAVGAAISVGLCQTRGISQSIMMPYSDRLQPFGYWYRQIWAESLGKEKQGTTPINALGTVDQHSQLQLYLDGPDDKLFTFIELEENGGGARFAEDLTHDPDLRYLRGHKMGDLLRASAQATADSLLMAGRPVRRLTLQRLDEHELGSLFMHFMLETILAADLFGVDPFGQPAVETGKRLARDYLKEV